MKVHKDAQSLEWSLDIEVSTEKDLGFRGSLAVARQTTLRKECTKVMMAVSIKFWANTGAVVRYANK